jgi:hypothetical protein
VAERKRDDTELKALNTTLKPITKAEWELTNGIRRINLRRNSRGPKLRWKWTQLIGKLVRKSVAGGINFWRYYKEIILIKLIPFAQ